MWKFRFEQILQHRERIKDGKMTEYAEAQADLHNCINVLQGLYQKVDQNFVDVQSQRENGESGSMWLTTHDEFFAGLQIKIEAQREKVRELKQVAEEKFEEFLEVQKEFKAIETLKKRDFEKHKFLKRKRDEKEIDDLITMNHKRNKASGI